MRKEMKVMNKLLGLAGVSVFLLACLTASYAETEASDTPEKSAVVTPSRSGEKPQRNNVFEGMVLDRLVNNPHVVERIGLSEAQVQTLRQAGEQIRKELQRIKAEREVASLDQARRMLDDSIDEAAVMANVETIGKLNTDIAKLKMKQLIVLRQTLTPEQLGRMKENRKRTDEKRANSGAVEGERRNKRLERGEQPAAAEPASNSTNAPTE
jgi:uncharacterized membrane protein